MDPDTDKDLIKEMKVSAKSVFIQRCKLFASRQDKLSDNMNKLYAVIWGQSSLALQTEIISLEDYEDKKKTFDCLWLLDNIELLTTSIDKKQDIGVNTVTVVKSLYYLRQCQNEPVEAYYRRFKSAVNTAKLLKASFTLHEGMIESVKDNNPGLEDKQINKIATDKFLGILYLTNADKDKYQNLWRELRNNSALGTNNYLANMTVAHDMLCRYSTENVESKDKTHSHKYKHVTNKVSSQRHQSRVRMENATL